MRRLTEDVQAIANLRLFQVTQVSVQTRQPQRRIGIAVEVLAQSQLAIYMGFTDQFENIPLQLARAARIQQLRLIELVGEQFQIAQRAIGFRTGQGRHQVIDDHRLSAPFGLCALARIIDDKWIDVRHRAQYGVRPAGSGQADALARQPLKVAVFADMHHGMSAVRLAQPEVKRQITVGRNQIRVVVHRAGVDLIATRRLNANEGQAKAQPGNHHSATAKHRIAVRRAPAGIHGITVFLRQLVERRQVFLQCHALLAGPQVNAVQIIGHATQQLLDKLGAAVRQLCQRITLGLHGAQDVQRRSRRVEPYTIADAPVAGRIVGQDQRHTLVAVGQPRQFDPAPRQLRDKIHPVRLGAVTHHVRLAALAAPGQVLETDRPTDDPPVQLRQGNVHRQIARTKALFAGLPGRFVVLRADRLNDRHVAPKRAQMRRFRTRLGKACGVEDQLGFSLVQPVLHLSETAGLLEAGHGYGQRVDAVRLQARTELVDKTGIGGLQVRAVEQQRHDGLPCNPVGLPIGELRTCQSRVVNGCAWQRLGLGPGIVPVQPVTGHATIHFQRILQAALTQKLP